MLFSTVALASLLASLGLASPLLPRAAPDNTVHITSETDFCLIAPRVPGTTVGDSESEGQMRAFCSAAGKTDPSQGDLPDNFWKQVTLATGDGWVQLTGCTNGGWSQLNDNDGGGQYDSSGGDGGLGNPRGSVCTGYNHYVELLEPAERRACIRCCQNPVDCRLDLDTSGCPAVIAGTYC